MEGHPVYSFQETLIAILLLFLVSLLTIFCLRCRYNLQPARRRRQGETAQNSKLKWSELRPAAEELKPLIQNNSDSPSSQEESKDKSIAQILSDEAVFISFNQDSMETVNPLLIKPGKPRAITSSVSFDTMELEWMKPEQGAHNITSYIVYGSTSNAPYQWIKQNAIAVASKDNKSCEKVLITNLLEKTTYYFKIRPECAAESTVSDSEISEPIKTKGIISSQPGKPMGSSLSHDSIQLEWTKPVLGAHNVTIYTILYYRSSSDPTDTWREQKTEAAEERATVTGLSENSTYLFKIRPESENGESGLESDESEPIHTAVIIPSKPGKPKEVKVTHDSIDLEWTKPEQGAHNVTSYIVYSSTSNVPYQWIEQNATTVKTDDKPCEKACITNLLEKTTYYYKIRPECRAEIQNVLDSDISEPIKTKGIMPSQPGKPVGTSLSNNSIQLEWIKPEQGAHNIIAYHVFYHSSKDPPDKWIKVKTEGIREKMTVSQLLERIPYSFKIQPESADGLGPESEVSEPISTKILIPSKPGKPKASNITDNSIDIEWTKPEQGAHNVNIYTILYCSTNDPTDTWKEQKTKEAEERATVTGLSEKTTYLFKVRPESENGESGLESDGSEPIQTTMLIPSKPGKPKAVCFSHNHMELEWTKPEKGSHNIVSYIISYCHTTIHSDPWTKIEETERNRVTVPISELSKENTYYYKVCLKYKDGSVVDGDISGPIKILTLSGVLDKLGRIGDKWRPLGAAFGLETYLDGIENDNRDRKNKWEHCLIDMIDLWLRHLGGTWEKLIGALKRDSVGLNHLADSIARSLSDETDSEEFQDDDGEGFKCRYCGECSIIQCVKHDCPKIKSSPDTIFPYLDTRDLTKQEREAMYTQLIEQTEEIMRKFAELIHHIVCSFQNNVNAELLAFSVTNIASLNSLTRSLSDSQDFDNIKSAVAVIKYLRKKKYITFFNFHIIKWLVEKHGVDEDKTKLSEYEKEFKKFCQRSVFEVPEGVFESPPHGGQVLAFKVTEHIKRSFPASSNIYSIKKSSQTLKLSLEDTLTIKKEITKKLFNSSDSNIIGSWNFLGANKGCVELKFSIPNSLLDREKQQYNAKTLTELPGFAVLETLGIKLLCGPPGKPYAIAVTGNSVNLQWSKPEYQGSHPIQYYYVHYKSLKDPMAKWRVVQSNVSKALETFEIRRLFQNNMPFIFKIQAISAIGAGLPSENSEPIYLVKQSFMIAKDIPSKPNKPGKPKALNITHNSVQLEWTKPEIGVERIASYIVLYHALFNDPSNQWTEIRAASTEESVIVSQLSENTTYVFQVEPEYEDSIGVESDVSDPVTTKIVMPSKPGKPRVTSITHDTIHLEWTKPKDGSHNIFCYTVFYCSTDASHDKWREQKTKAAEERATVTGLSENSAYLFKVRPESENGESGLESDESEPICTAVIIPSKPGKPKEVKVTHDSIELEWTKPEQGAHNIMSYIVYSSTSNAPYQWIERNATTVTTDDKPCEKLCITNLLEKTTYYFKIRLECAPRIRNVLDSEISEPIKTRGIIPSQPGKPVGTSLNHNSIQLEWTKPEQGAHSVIAYRILYHSDKDPPNTWIRVKTEDIQEKVTVSQLSENTLYSFKIQPESADGLGPESEVSEQIPTKILVPSKPGKPKASNITHDSINLEWTKPEQGAHNVIIYTILYCSTNDPCDTWREQKTKAAEERATVTGLLEKTTYFFKVQPESENEESGLVSDESEPILTAMIIPSKPGKPNAVKVTHDSIELEWTKPEQGAHNVIAYHIFYHSNKDPSDKWMEVENEGIQEKVIVSQLLEKTLYSFKIWPESVDGLGPESEISEQISTKIMIPSKPGKPKASKITHHSIDLEWTKPEQGAHNVTIYTILYRSASDPTDTWREQKTKAAEERVTVMGLSENSAYLFKVRPESENEESGLESDESDSIQTAAVIINEPNFAVRNPGHLTVKNYQMVLNTVWEARIKWYYLGVELGQQPDELETIKQKYRDDPEICFPEIILSWLRGANPQPVWQALAEALRAPCVGFGQLAEEVEKMDYSSEIMGDRLSDPPSSVGSGDRKNILTLFDNMDLSKYYPQKLSLQQVLCIRKDTLGEKMCDDPKLLPFLIIRKIMSYDCRCRLSLQMPKSPSDNDSSDSDDVSSTSSGASVQEYVYHPMDCLLAVFHCADNFLRQELMARLTMCQIAIPFLLPDPITKQLTLPLWGMKSIIKEWRSSLGGSEGIHEFEGPITKYKTPIISFLRLSKQIRSKSNTMNEVISESNCQHFYHSDMKGGSYPQLLGDGVVDVCWYLPAGRTNDTFHSVVTFLNLHGDARCYPQQIAFLSQISIANYIFISEEDVNDRSNEQSLSGTKLLETLTKSPGGVVLLSEEVPKGGKVDQARKEISSRIKIIRMKNKNSGEIKMAIRRHVNKTLHEIWTKERSKMIAIDSSECIDLAHSLNIKIDEDDKELIEGRTLADSLIEILMSHKHKNLSSKEAMLPLQGKKLWLKWASLDKEEHRQVNRGGEKFDRYSLRKHFEMKEVRKLQFHHLEHMTPLMESFIVSILRSSKKVRDYFLQCVKLSLNNLSREVTLKLQHSYKENHGKLLKLRAMKEVNQAAVKECKLEIEELHEQIINASLGLEHLLRELGQVYEVTQELTHGTTEQFSQLPHIAAELLISGYPLEIMDGYAAHVPSKWIKAVLDEVGKILNDPTVFALTVLGLQSTGKSTLINTAFGLQFNVGAGRRTLGAFMQLLTISEELKEQIMCDYILVIDTEGLRAPELGTPKTQTHDNELATFVIGLADVTLINIYGEVPGDMDDILQTAVHAFIRMNSVKLNPSCQFIHQNVGSVIANRKADRGRSRFKDKLDSMTRAAAKEENCEGQYEYFSEVIQFSDQNDVHQFPGLWRGDPPMAPVNPGYSEKAQQLVLHLIGLIKRKNEMGSAQLTTFKTRMQDLWKALLNESFVFCFKNTMEITVYNSLQAEYIQWSWSFKRQMLEWQQTAENKIKSIRDKNEILALQKSLIKELPEFVQSILEEIQAKLIKYFEESEQREMLAQWQSDAQNRLKHLAQDEEYRARDLCVLLSGAQRARAEVGDLNKIYRERMLANLKEVVANVEEEIQQRIAEQGENLGLNIDEEQIRAVKEELKEKELQETFKSLWQVWIQEISYTLPHQHDNIDVEADIHKVLIEVFRSHEPIIIKELKSKPLQEWGKVLNLPILSKYVGLKKKLGIFRGTGIAIGPHVGKAEPNEYHMKQAEHITLDLFERTENFLQRKRNEKYSAIHFQDLLQILIGAITDYTKKEHSELILTPDYRIAVCITACGFAMKQFEETVEAMRKQNDLLAYIEQELRNPLYTMFKDKYNHTTQDMVTAATFCELLAEPIQRQVENSLGPVVVTDIVGNVSFLSTKANLVTRMLVDMGDQVQKTGDLTEYLVYLQDPKRSLERWIKHYTVQHCEQVGGNGETKLVFLGKIQLKYLTCFIQKKVLEVSGTFKNVLSLETWLNEVCNLETLEGQLQLDLEIFDTLTSKVNELKNLDYFTEEVQTGLSRIHGKLSKEIERYTAKDMETWKKRPYDILFDQLRGCCEECPFCKEQCELLIEGHICEHDVKYHRPICLGGQFTHTREMIPYTCSYLVTSEKLFKNSDTGDNYHRYKNYAELYPKWRIIPDRSIEAESYWKWFLGHYADKVAKAFGAKANEIPKEWKTLFTWEDIKKELLHK